MTSVVPPATSVGDDSRPAASTQIQIDTATSPIPLTRAARISALRYPKLIRDEAGRPASQIAPRASASDADVGHHVGRVGEQGEAAGDEAAHHLGHREAGGERQHPRQGAGVGAPVRAVRVRVRVMVVAVAHHPRVPRRAAGVR